MIIRIKNTSPNTYMLDESNDFSVNGKVEGKFKVIRINEIENEVTLKLDEKASIAYQKYTNELEELNKRKFFSIRTQ